MLLLLWCCGGVVVVLLLLLICLFFFLYSTLERYPSHYAPNDEFNDPRYPVGTAKCTFWQNHAEHWDPDFYDQCKRMGYWYGFNDPRRRPSDEAYLKDAEDHCAAEVAAKMKEIYEQRIAWREEQETLEQEKSTLIETGNTLQVQLQQQQQQHQIDLLAKQIATNQEKYEKTCDLQKTIDEKLKRHHCSIKAIVSYSTAIQFYRRYKLKFGIVAADTCRECGKYECVVTVISSGGVVG